MIVALDVGTRTIGVATTTRMARIATPRFTVRRKGVRQDVARLLEALARDDVEAWVVGLPLEEDGSETRSARLARQVGDALFEVTGLPVHYQDEGYTTVEASHRLHAAGLDSRQQRPLIDQAAAAVILQDWLDAEARRPPEP